MMICHAAHMGVRATLKACKVAASGMQYRGSGDRGYAGTVRASSQ